MGPPQRKPRRPGTLALLAAVLGFLFCLLAALTYNSAAGSTANQGTGRIQPRRGGRNGGAAATGTLRPAPRKLKLTADIKRRCDGTLGTWCADFHTQAPVPAVTAPRGNQTCSLDCNKAGWMGFNCLHPMKRYCTHKHRQFGFEVSRVEPDLAAGMQAQTFWDFPTSHCAGTCDEDIAACYCPSHTPYGRLPAPEDAPLGSPPERQGRPMGLYCQPSKLDNGTATAWGEVEPELLFGPEGWCTSEAPRHVCDCFVDGWGGNNCELRYEAFCLNQCNGRGECNQGYCKCDPGWHGIDCAHASAAADDTQPGREADRPWIAELVRTPAARTFPPDAVRRRPLIYVYEMPAEYVTLMIQYRWGGTACVPRYFDFHNETHLSEDLYAAESGFLEMLLQSEHRTLDPEEADFLYVPAYTSCLITPVQRTADSLRDMWYGVENLRVHAATHMLLEAYYWIKAHAPYWNRRGGWDHIWLVTFDEASCYVPAAIRASIILSHWGRMDANHTSGSGYWEDVYSDEVHHPHWEPDGFLQKIAGHPCYDPVKARSEGAMFCRLHSRLAAAVASHPCHAQQDLVVPLMKTPQTFYKSPLLGATPRSRTWLAFHRGRVQQDNPPYSRGLRQRLANASAAGGWLEKHKIVMGEHDVVEGDYSELLASSTFCLVLPGDGWSARMDDAMLHGCIPVIIMDNVHVSFESILDLAAFTVRIPQADAERLPEVLAAVPEERRREMRRALSAAWQKFGYTSYGPYARKVRELQRANAEEAAAARRERQAEGGDGDAAPASLPAAVPDLDPAADDAFGTIMAWLHSRIEATR
ncbi:hypothetical protein CHLNCDRAFT_51514 [Chlorella variabilis]|uniref:EGF-like domain-containing protein n=1 Tax=Chlorella variabilis TaxID=554065 RepID=E1ZC33_CHLVA|nr:hypothetical protein CHLNCDRAFT_51514 [Chlorella variabilis]EFN56537.1 hypothetical protein CHLNCDRAFT_51514 [Chlorella variabilis]|eukprot:XP_005848639.1 hypothetical protein CHLNCDRAFT_51514 [Chlorella variabilis]